VCSDVRREYIDEPSGSIQHGLQSVLEVYRDTHKDRGTLIQLGDDQCSDQCQQGVLRERPSHATDLVQCCKTRSDGVGDLGPHGDVGVDVDTKIPGCSDGDTKASPTLSVTTAAARHSCR